MHHLAGRMTMVAQVDLAYLRYAGPWRTTRRLLSYGLFEGRPATTRGQFANPAIRKHVQMAAHFPPLRSVDRPIFILGMGRSGTTVLGRVLSVHADVAFLNEPKIIWSTLVPGEDVSGFYQSAGRFRLAADDVSAKDVSAIRSVYSYYLWLSRGRRLVEKYPELTYRYQLLERIFPSARYIFLFRNVGDVAQSVTAWNLARRSLGSDDWWGVRLQKWNQLTSEFLSADGPYGYLMAEIGHDLLQRTDVRVAFEWLIAADAGLGILQSAGERAIAVSYERFAANPQIELERLTFACGLRQDPQAIAFSSNILRPLDRPYLPLESLDLPKGLLAAIESRVRRLHGAL